MTDWIEELERQCRASTQAAVARALGISASTVNQVIKRSYAADTRNIEQLVRGRFMKETVLCPVLGVLRRDDCVRHQARKLTTGNRIKIRLHEACLKCANAQGGGDAA